MGPKADFQTTWLGGINSPTQSWIGAISSAWPDCALYQKMPRGRVVKTRLLTVTMEMAPSVFRLGFRKSLAGPRKAAAPPSALNSIKSWDGTYWPRAGSR